MYTRDYETLLNQLGLELTKGIDLITSLNDKTYRHKDEGVASIGSHVRHIIDFCNNFLKGIDAEKINYNLRERDVRIEEERSYAQEQLQVVIEKILSLSSQQLEQSIPVCSEIDHSLWHTSTIGRELEFVESHTVHHYALIAMKLRFLGEAVPEGFGVSGTTLTYRKGKALE